MQTEVIGLHSEGQRNSEGLGWVGLGWAGLGWAGLGWVRLGWVGLRWVYDSHKKYPADWLPFESYINF